jgi:ABC-type molybdate transport system substrate-binding protein
VWPSVEPKMAMTVNVRAALAYVARGEAPLGIVYATDAKVEPGVKVIGVFPHNSHDPIIYPVAAINCPLVGLWTESRSHSSPSFVAFTGFRCL